MSQEKLQTMIMQNCGELGRCFMGFVQVENITSGFRVAVCLFSNRSQKASECGKNISDTLGDRLVRNVFLATF